ncbi:hypothetical protein ACFT5D_02645 [Streptomyces sp. NPDC057144]|uniref:hypothetical protein n=1 Tax=Streptomyces sp. NPDC057144 TaxID=3346034 RepID=UPI00363B038A
MPTRWLEEDNTLVMPDGVRVATASPTLSGLHMAQNSYKWELTADRREVRGADGGGAECSGEPWFTKWLIQASSSRPRTGRLRRAAPAHTRGTLVRPAIPLDCRGARPRLPAACRMGRKTASTQTQVTGQTRRLEIAEAKTEGWLGKVESLQVSLAGAEQKLRQLGRGNGQHTAVDLGSCVG